MISSDSVILIHRLPISDDNGISLEAWLSYIASSDVLHEKPREERQGINPFTKQPWIYRSSRGGAFFEGPRGRCEVYYDSGGLTVHGAVDHAEEVVKKIAADLSATVQVYDPATGTTVDLWRF